MSIRDILDKLEDSASIDQNFALNWTEKGRGFGQYYFHTDPVSGRLHIDNECDDKEAIKRILCKLVDSAILDDDPIVAPTNIEDDNNHEDENEDGQ